MKKKSWLAASLLCLLISVGTLFLPVLTYRYSGGGTVNFNVLSFLEPGELTFVLEQYTGPWETNVDSTVATMLAALAVLSIVAAFVGVITMSMQRSNRWQFVLALVGIIGTAIPSLLIFAAVLLSRDYFPGSFLLGAYPIVTPVSMVVCMIMVTRKHKLTQAEREAQRQARQYIRRGGDLI